MTLANFTQCLVRKSWGRLTLFSSRKPSSEVHTRPHRYPRRLVDCASVLVLTLGGTSGCMLSPTDGTSVADPLAPLPFEGYLLQGNANVQVRAWDFTSHRMENVGEPVRSASSVTYTVDDVDLYAWSASRTLPSRFWRAGPAGGRCAVVGAQGGSSNLMTVESDWASCYGRHPNVTDFTSNCAADNSPRAKLYSRDWGSVTLTRSQLDFAATVASALVRVRFDNYTGTAYEFCSTSNPEGCPPGGASDPETYKYYRPEASFVRNGRDALTFSIPPARHDPATIYIDDMNSRSIDFRVEGGQLVFGINFEADGPEIRTNCIRHAACAFVDGRTVDFTAPRAELRFRLAVQNGKIRYDTVQATFQTGTTGEEAEQAEAALAEGLTELLGAPGEVRDVMSEALDALLRGASELTAYPIEAVQVSGNQLRIRPGCPMD